jgi:hypothetical protein
MSAPLDLNHCIAIVESTMERREHERFPVKSEVFLALRPNYDRVGSVRDISKTGISFEYLAFEDFELAGSVEVDIFSRSQDFYISRIPCRIVYDVRKDSVFFLDDAQTRRCGLLFEPHGNQQTSNLLAFFNDMS